MVNLYNVLFSRKGYWIPDGRGAYPRWFQKANSLGASSGRYSGAKFGVIALLILGLFNYPVKHVEFRQLSWSGVLFINTESVRGDCE